MSLVAYLALMQLCVCFIYVNATRAWIRFQQGQTLAPPNEEQVKYLTPSTVEKWLEGFCDTVNPILNRIVAIARCRPNFRSVQAILALYAIALVGRLFSGITLLTILWVLCFTLPKLYLLNRELVDRQLQMLSVQFHSLYGIVLNKMPGFLRGPSSSTATSGAVGVSQTPAASGDTDKHAKKTD